MSDGIVQISLAVIAAVVSISLKWLDGRSNKKQADLQPEPDDESLGTESNAQTDDSYDDEETE